MNAFRGTLGINVVQCRPGAVHPSVVGRHVQVAAGLETVLVTCHSNEVARHVRSWADHQTITDPAHKAAAVALRQARRLIAAQGRPTAEHRDLADYDRKFGLSETNQEIA